MMLYTKKDLANSMAKGAYKQYEHEFNGVVEKHVEAFLKDYSFSELVEQIPPETIEIFKSFLIESNSSNLGDKLNEENIKRWIENAINHVTFIKNRRK